MKVIRQIDEQTMRTLRRIAEAYGTPAVRVALRQIDREREIAAQPNNEGQPHDPNAGAGRVRC